MKSSGSVLLLSALFLLIPACISAQQPDLIDYFPHNVGDLWQYEEMSTSLHTVHGFSSRKIFEIRVTRVDTLEDGSRYVYVNNNHKPRWYIDSLYVYQLPSKLKIFNFAPDELRSWWLTPHSDTTDFGEWRHMTPPVNGEIFGRPYQLLQLSEWGHADKGDMSNLSYRNRIESYIPGIGLIGVHADYANVAQNWQLKGAVTLSDTLGTIKEMEETDIFDWFPVHVGNRWQYYDTEYGELSEVKITQVDTLMDGSLEVYINDQFRYLVNPANATIHYSSAGFRENMHLYLMTNAGMREPWWRREFDPNQCCEIWIQMTHSYEGDIFSHQFDMRVYNYNLSYYAGNYSSSIAHDFDYVYAKGIGKIYEADYERIFKYLVAAEIDGQIFGTLVSIDEDETDVPAAFTLHQNYPNPFNPSTVIRYELPEGGHVRLAVYDMTGRRVAELMNGLVQAGSHTADFDGSRLASGVYVYRLQSGGQVLTGKMMLVK